MKVQYLFSKAARIALLATSGLAAQLVHAPAAAAQDGTAGTYPDRPVRLVVAFAPGGAADIVMRKLAPKLSTTLGATIIIENRSGANGNIAAQYVAGAAPDGYTLLSGFPGLASNPSIYKMDFDPLKVLMPIKMVAEAPVLLIASPHYAQDSVQAVIQDAKARPERVRYGDAGIGSSGHLAGELFEMAAQVDMQHIPYKGGAPAINDLMGGQIDLVFDSIPGSRAFVDGKRVKPLAFSGAERSPIFPDVPTFKESGLPDYRAGTWFGVLGPAGLPPAIRSKLADAIGQVLQDPAFVAELNQMGISPDNRSSEEFEQFMREETAKWAKVVKAAGIQIQ